MTAYHLAHLNIARFSRDPEDPSNVDFMEALDPVNAEADEQPGFIWRLKDEDDHSHEVPGFDNPRTLVNLSVWENVESLEAFAYRNEAHRAIMMRRREWFDRLDVTLVLWWVPAGHIPTLHEAKQRLDTLTEAGPGPEAFNFRKRFPAPASG